jgi:hypothetical protein
MAGFLQQQIEIEKFFGFSTMHSQPLARLRPERSRLINIVRMRASMRRAAISACVELKNAGTAIALLSGLPEHPAANSRSIRLVDLRAFRIHANPKARQTAVEVVNTAWK